MVGEDPEFDDFLARVENVSQTVNKLARGEISADECEAINVKIERRRPSQPQPEKRYRPGSGNSDHYAVFCRLCSIEHDDRITSCARCGQSDALESRQERQGYLKQRVQELMTERERRSERRQRWRRYREDRVAAKRAETDFERWQVWEPDTDSDDEPVPDRNDPRFTALDADIRRRDAEFARKRRQADDYKNEGNTCFAQHRYIQACDLYTKAIELKKDNPAYYTNRALAYLHTDQYQLALADCESVLDMAEFFDGNRRQKRNEFVRKAWIRHAMALHGLLRFDEAIESLNNGALVCAPGDIEAVALLKQYEKDCDEYSQERRLRTDAEYDEFRSIVSRFRAGEEVVESVVNRVCELGNIGKILFRALKGLTFALVLLPTRTASITPLLIAASSDNDRNLHLIAKPKHLDRILGKLQERQLGDEDTLALCQLLLHLCQLESARKHVTAGFDGNRLWRVLNQMQQRPGNDEIRIAALGVVANLAMMAPFRRAIRESRDGERIHGRLVAIVSSKSASDQLKERALHALNNLLVDGAIRAKFAVIDDLRAFQVLTGTLSVVWKRIRRQNVDWYGRDALFYTLNIVLNLASEPTALRKLIECDLVEKAAMLAGQASGRIRQRSLQIVAQCAKLEPLPKVILHKTLPVIFELLNDESCLSHSVRALAALSRQSDFVKHLYERQSQTNVRKRLVQLVYSSSDHQVVGNICLCISRCIDADSTVITSFQEIIPRLAEIILNSDIDQAIRRNVAITMAKMSRLQAVLSKLRELRVLECMLSTAQSLLR